MAAKFPNNDDKDNGISWIRNPNQLLNVFSARPTVAQNTSSSNQQKNESLDAKEKDKTVKSKKNKAKEAKNKNDNINPPFGSSLVSEMKCLDIVENLVSKFKSGDTAFVKVVEDLCNIYNCKNTKKQKFKIELIEKLLLNLEQADYEEIRTLKDELKNIFIDEPLKKLFVDEQDIFDMFDIRGEFFLGQLKKDGVYRRVYLKTNPFSIDQFRNEATLLSKLDHPNIYNVLAITRNFSTIAFEIDGYTNLKNLFLDREFTHNFKKVIDMLIKIAETMEYIHSQDILYNNLTSNSIRIKNENIKIYKFDYAAYVGDSNGEYINRSQPFFLFYHVSPETVKNGIWTTKNDVWAMGMLCYEFFYYWSIPLSIPLEITMLRVVDDIHQGLRKLKRPAKCPEVLFSYMTEKLLNSDPEKRPNFTEIVTALHDIGRR